MTKGKIQFSENISKHLFIDSLKHNSSKKDVSYLCFKFIRNKSIIHKELSNEK